MSIVKGKPTKDGRIYSFKVRYTDLNGEQKQYLSKRYALKKDAQEAERKFMLTLTDKVDKSSITFKDLILEYDTFQKDKVKITTYSEYKKRYKHLESLYNIKVKDFDLTQYNLWKEKINKTSYATSYKNDMYKTLRALLNFGNKYLNINTSIIDKIRNFTNPNEIKKEMLFFTYEEFKKFINEEQDIKYKTFFETLYYCGLRKEEANALNWNDIDFNKNTININKSLSMKIKGKKFIVLPPKTKSSIRILPITNILKNDLLLLYNEYCKYINFDKSWFVFGGIYPLSDSNIAVKKNKNCELANVKQIRIHDFRHSCASLLINNGCSISLVAKYLGHSNISTTLNTYTHMFKNELDDIVNSINNLEKQ